MTPKAQPRPKVEPSLYASVLPIQRAVPSPHRPTGRDISTGRHKFAVGQTLFFTPSTFDAPSGKGRYDVVRLMPADSGDNQYRLKSVLDGQERVARESQLHLE